MLPNQQLPVSAAGSTGSNVPLGSREQQLQTRQDNLLGQLEKLWASMAPAGEAAAAGHVAKTDDADLPIVCGAGRPFCATILAICAQPSLSPLTIHQAKRQPPASAAAPQPAKVDISVSANVATPPRTTLLAAQLLQVRWGFCSVLDTNIPLLTPTPFHPQQNEGRTFRQRQFWHSTNGPVPSNFLQANPAHNVRGLSGCARSTRFTHTGPLCQNS